MTFDELRAKHPRLIYQAYKIEQQSNQVLITFQFLLEPDVTFTPQVTLPFNQIDATKLENFVFHLGLAELVSYWKTACPKEIVIEAGNLNSEQIAWWKDLFINGLGEFFYNNQIDPSQKDLLTITSNASKPILKPLELQASGDLILVGGGKDSAVTLELLKKTPTPKTVLFLNPTRSSRDAAKLAGYTEQIVVNRTIDPKLLDLNNEGYLNGHTPFSAYLSFLGTLVGAITSQQNIIVSNERSASDASLNFHGLEINHQYSKGYRYEKMFRQYCQSYLSKNTNYFSFLRPLYDLQISSIFASLPENQHFSFRSCNVNQKQDSWCGTCAKCAFVYLSLFPFLPYEKTLKIFGKDFFAQVEIQKQVVDLVGLGEHKPFDCVGTEDESKLAVGLSIKKYRESRLEVPQFLLGLEGKLGLDENLLEELTAQVKNKWGEENFLPDFYSQILKKAGLKGQTEIQGDKILIAGYGVEGKSTHRFLQENYPNLKVGIADNGKVEPLFSAPLGVFTGENYLDFATKFDTIFRSPGIPSFTMRLLEAQRLGKKITSSTNLFFSQATGKIIGVTGTKGKSTTSSLIAAILSKVYKDVRLVGNIGNPCLDNLKGATAETVFVIELSSQQLEDIKYSPDIAVLLAVYPEHLDKHGSLGSYIAAKTRIVTFQTSQSSVIFNNGNELVSNIASRSEGQKVPFSNLPEGLQTNLLGPGNLENLRAAITTATLFKVPFEKIREAVAEFKTLEHRLEYVGEKNGIKFYNDSLSTIPEALINALETLGENVETIIVGGYDRGLDFNHLGKYLASRKGLKNVVYFPTTGQIISDLISKSESNQSNHFQVKTMEEAVKIALAKTGQGKICLLSPASPSFGIFKDYADRGNQFKKLVLEN